MTRCSMNILLLLVTSLIVLSRAQEKKKKPDNFNLDYVEDVVYSTQNPWKDGYSGFLQFTLTRTVFHWTITFKYLGKLAELRFYDGEMESVSAGSGTTEFLFKNKPYNGKLEKGTTQTFNFMGMFPANGPLEPEIPSVVVSFRGKVIFRNDIKISTTLAPDQPRRTTDINHVLYLIKENKLPTLATNQVTTTSTTTEVLIIRQPPPSTIPPIPEEKEEDKTADESDEKLRSICKMLLAWSKHSNNTITKTLYKNCNHNSSSDLVTTTTTPNNITLNVNSSISNTTTPSTTTVISSNTTQNTTTSVPTTPPTSIPTTKYIGPNQYKRLRILTSYNYVHALHLSNMFYEAQKSGKLPPDNRVPWRGDSALHDRGEHGEDLSGGFYDAGDNVKFGFPMAFSLTVLSWGGIEFLDVYKETEEIGFLMQNIKWGTDYIIKAHVSKFELYGQVGDPEKDHLEWDRPENVTNDRPAFKISPMKPGSDLAAETAAALFAASILFYKYHNQTTPYQLELVRHGEELMEFAELHRGLYHNSILSAKQMYKSSGDNDEITWAKLWQYRATGNRTHFDKATGIYYNRGMFRSTDHLQFSWDDKIHGIQMLLAQVSDKLKPEIKKTVGRYCSDLRSKETLYSNKGLLFLSEWGPLRYAANSALICLMAANEGIEPQANKNFVKYQLHYMLGSKGQSYVVGFGKKYPKQAHHRGSSCPFVKQRCSWNNFHSRKPNPNILYGALVGGPSKVDEFKDIRKDYKQSEVTLDYNAGFQGAVAGLIQDAIYNFTRVTETQRTQLISKRRSNELWYKHYEKYYVPPTLLYGNDPENGGVVPRSSLQLLFVCLLCFLATLFGDGYR